MKVSIGRYPKDPNKEQKVNVQIDKWDTWSMDATLAHIIVPMLKQLKATKHGAPLVYDEDVPEDLRRPAGYDHESYSTDDNWFKRWDYVMNEMIFAFESKINNWEDRIVRLTADEYDWKVYNLVEARIQRGFELFGKYYKGLWD
jgi:hypothetical protein